MTRRHPRLFRATRFFGLSLSLFIIVLFTWIFNKMMDALPLNGRPPPLDWLEFLLGYLLLATVFFWVTSKTNPQVWKNISRVLGWDEEADKPVKP